MKWEHVAYVESSSDPGTRYEIKCHPETGVLGCSCMAYRFTKQRPKTCKHLAAHGAAVVSATWQTSVRQTLRNVTVGGETFTFLRGMRLTGSITEGT